MFLLDRHKTGQSWTYADHLLLFLVSQSCEVSSGLFSPLLVPALLGEMQRLGHYGEGRELQQTPFLYAEFSLLCSTEGLSVLQSREQAPQR